MADDKKVTAEKLRESNIEELTLRLEEAKHDMFRLRVKSTTKELENTNEIRAKRREIARIKTIINQKNSEASA